jgi:hypothetical protein
MKKERQNREPERKKKGKQWNKGEAHGNEKSSRKSWAEVTSCRNAT